MLSKQDRQFRAIMQGEARHIRLVWYQCYCRSIASRLRMVKEQHRTALEASRTLGILK